jgi:hypothetical protein
MTDFGIQVPFVTSEHLDRHNLVSHTFCQPADACPVPVLRPAASWPVLHTATKHGWGFLPQYTFEFLQAGRLQHRTCHSLPRVFKAPSPASAKTHVTVKPASCPAAPRRTFTYCNIFSLCKLGVTCFQKHKIVRSAAQDPILIALCVCVCVCVCVCARAPCRAI